jgi:hypothetical protein
MECFGRDVAQTGKVEVDKVTLRTVRCHAQNSIPAPGRVSLFLPCETCRMCAQTENGDYETGWTVGEGFNRV